MKKLFLILPIIGLTSLIQADFLTDLKQKYEEVKDALGNVSTPRRDTEAPNRPEEAASKEDTVMALLRKLGIGSRAEDQTGSKYASVKQSNAAAKQFAQEAIRSQDPAKKKQAQGLLREAEQNVAKLEAQEKEILNNLARERAEIQKLQSQLSGSPRSGLFDWLASLNR